MATRFFDVRIAGTGVFLPERIITNAELIPEFGGFSMTPDKLHKLLGAKERRIASPEMTIADMMARAAQQALEQAEIKPSEVDLIIVAPVPPDAVTPPTAALVQHLIGGSPDCTAFDINMACVGVIAAMEIAGRFLETGSYRNAVIAGGTILSRNNAIWTNPMHRFIFGDGAGAIVLQKAQRGEQLIVQTRMAAEGNLPQTVFYPFPHSIKPPLVPQGWDGFYMATREDCFEVVDHPVDRFVKDFWSETGVRPDQIAHAIIHQPTRDIFLRSVEVSGVPLERVFQNFETEGNLIAAEIPVGLHALLPRLRSGERLYSLSYGAGISIGSFLYEVP